MNIFFKRAIKTVKKKKKKAEIDVTMPNDSGSTALHYFARSFDGQSYNEATEGLVAKMLKKGAKPNAKVYS